MDQAFPTRTGTIFSNRTSRQKRLGLDWGCLCRTASSESTKVSSATRVPTAARCSRSTYRPSGGEPPAAEYSASSSQGGGIHLGQRADHREAATGVRQIWSPCRNTSEFRFRG